MVDHVKPNVETRFMDTWGPTGSYNHTPNWFFHPQFHVPEYSGVLGVNNFSFFCVVSIYVKVHQIFGLLTSMWNVDQEGVEEEEVTKPKPQRGVLVVGAWAGEAIRIVVNTTD